MAKHIPEGIPRGRDGAVKTHALILLNMIETRDRINVEIEKALEAFTWQELARMDLITESMRRRHAEEISARKCPCGAELVYRLAQYRGHYYTCPDESCVMHNVARS